MAKQAAISDVIVQSAMAECTLGETMDGRQGGHDPIDCGRLPARCAGSMLNNKHRCQPLYPQVYVWTWCEKGDREDKSRGTCYLWSPDPPLKNLQEQWCGFNLSWQCAPYQMTCMTLHFLPEYAIASPLPSSPSTYDCLSTSSMVCLYCLLCDCGVLVMSSNVWVCM